MLRIAQYLSLLIVVNLTVLSCKKTDSPASTVTIRIDNDIVYLENHNAHKGALLKVIIENLSAGESDDIIWTTEDPQIVKIEPHNPVTKEATIWPKQMGETYIIAQLANGKSQAKCKVIVTDDNDYKFRLILTNKGKSNLSLNNPEKFLSAKAIQRRLKHNIPVDQLDLPISNEYINAIQEIGGDIVTKSKWLNTVTVHVTNYLLIDKYKELPFVKEIQVVWQGRKNAENIKNDYIDIPQINNHVPTNTPIDYGYAIDNIEINNGQALHKLGFKGAGIDIAVIDAGFLNLNKIPAFKNVNIKGAKSFIYENNDPYSIDTHGLWVTSCMAINQPGFYVGTAPEANYWLLRSEDQSSEQHVEEDYWVSAAEFADSVGVDIINSSLYYGPESFYNPSYKFEDMDGKSTIATKAANIAASRGIFIVNCAGNDRSWVGSPADSPHVLTVGAVTTRLEEGLFTAWGITVDGRMKPDVMALGDGAIVIGTNGTHETRSGTSYASPIVAGLAACLLQAFPDLTNSQLLNIIQKSSDRAHKPVIPYGYGIPNMQKAIELSTIESKKSFIH